MKNLPILLLLAAVSAFALSFLNLEAAAMLVAAAGLFAVAGADYGRKTSLSAVASVARLPRPVETLGLAA